MSGFVTNVLKEYIKGEEEKNNSHEYLVKASIVFPCLE